MCAHYVEKGILTKKQHQTVIYVNK